MDETSVKSARDYLKEQFDTCGDSAWLEGWVCGFTDPQHGALEGVKEELMKYLAKLRRGPILHTVGELIDHLRTMDPKRSVIFDRDGNTDGVSREDIAVWDPSDDESPVAIYINF